MQLLVPQSIIKRLERELRRARSREIGGILMGEHVRDEIFRVVEFSVQRGGGTDACFVRELGDHKAQLEKFFAQTGEDYTRFNYIGEWHSHPSFEPLPSDPDIRTMQTIVEDPDVGANFLILMVCRIDRGRVLEVTATAFCPGVAPIAVPVSFELEPPAAKITFMNRIRNFIRLDGRLNKRN